LLSFLSSLRGPSIRQRDEISTLDSAALVKSQKPSEFQGLLCGLAEPCFHLGHGPFRFFQEEPLDLRDRGVVKRVQLERPHEQALMCPWSNPNLVDHPLDRNKREAKGLRAAIELHGHIRYRRHPPRHILTIISSYSVRILSCAHRWILPLQLPFFFS
jgi:hypothetical protein